MAVVEKQKRGFAVMDPARQREIASMGGRKSQDTGVGHQWTSDEARIAGRKGGLMNAGRPRKRPLVPSAPSPAAWGPEQGIE